MKISLITSRKRFESYSDPAMVPADAELFFMPLEYTEEEAMDKLADTEILLVDSVLPVTAKMIEAMPKLKMIQAEGVAYNKIDIEAAKSAGVFVCNNKAVNAAQVAEHSVMLILAVMHRLIEGDAQVRAGNQNETKLRFINDGLEDIIGKKVGLVGFGAIGKELAKRLLPFGCQLFYYDPFRASAEVEQEYSITYLEKEELLSSCDVITLHVPVTPSTTNFINKEALAIMKPNAIIINAARGLVVDTQALADAIMAEQIYGAGLDTIEPEPVPADSPVLLMPEPYCSRVVLSPHVAGTTKSVFFSAYRNFWGNVKAVSNGQRPINIVNEL
ncbi:MAG: hypothetical protein E7420_06285 [Ruminococcaceae bacterium]|nr:hypothetical protein [Oscillospiraceae bacterium]